MSSSVTLSKASKKTIPVDLGELTVRLTERQAEIEKIRTNYAHGCYESKEVKPEEEFVFTILSDQLRFSRKHVQQWPRGDPLAAEIIVNNVESHLRNFLSVGPHGPGAGKPASHGPGTVGPGGGRPFGTHGGQKTRQGH